VSAGAVRVLGVRHHGPGSARAVGAGLDQLDPDVVVIEGPPELDRISGLAGSPSMRPPVAALTYVPDQSRRASFYPMAVFSPEWVALRWALDHERPVRFADLTAAHMLARRDPDGRRGGADANGEGEADAEGEVDAAGGDGAGADGEGADRDADPGAEGDIEPVATRVRTDPLAVLAAAAGFDDPERWWEDAIEHRHHGLEAFDAVLEAMTEVRAATGPTDLDLTREAAMRKVLRSLGGQTVAVVCGAWHAPVLVPDHWPTATSDTARLRGLPKVKVAATWVPWTSRRLGYASGYGAGVASPGWYHHLFTAPDEPVARWLVRTAELLRAEQHDTSSAALIEAHRLADALAALRGRPIPGLSELWDATESVICGGSPVPMDLVEDRLLVGDVLGRVPDDTPMVPLARDLAALQKRLRLKPSAAASMLTLDLRTASHLERSRLFHRLALLGIHWAVPADGGRTTGTFKEAWTLEWRPELAIAVIEASAAGTTVAAAAADTVTRRAGEADIAQLCSLVEQALLADLPDAIGQVLSALEERAALQHDTLRLMTAVEPLARVARYGDVRSADVALVGDVLSEIVLRICVGLPAASSALDDDAAETLREQVDAVQRGLSVLGASELRAAWLDSLTALAARRDVHGLVAGRAVRLLLDAARIDSEDANQSLSLALSRAGEPVRAAAFIEGFLAGDALLLLHDHALLEAIDSWLGAVHRDVFDDLLPLLRRAFAAYEPAERRMIGDHVRQVGAGDGRDGARDHLDEERAARTQPLLRQLLGLAKPATADVNGSDDA
jgi:Family of unknown function (DUF5682)